MHMLLDTVVDITVPGNSERNLYALSDLSVKSELY